MLNTPSTPFETLGFGTSHFRVWNIPSKRPSARPVPWLRTRTHAAGDASSGSARLLLTSNGKILQRDTTLVCRDSLAGVVSRLTSRLELNARWFDIIFRKTLHTHKKNFCRAALDIDSGSAVQLAFGQRPCLRPIPTAKQS